MHVKENSKDIVMSEVAKIFADSASIKSAWVDAFKDKKAFDFIFETADQITSNPSESMEINDKVVLSIAIRLKAEQFIIDEIEGHDDNLDRVNEERDKNKSQFGKLLQLYKNTFPKEAKKTLLLDEVNLMTSENIHINSFMFEPIIDMSILSLAQLYADFQLLCNREDICEEVILTKH